MHASLPADGGATGGPTEVAPLVLAVKGGADVAGLRQARKVQSEETLDAARHGTWW